MRNGAGPEGPTPCRFRVREGREGCYLMIFVTVPAPDETRHPLLKP